MNKKSTFRSVANNYLTHPKSTKGITLVALIITIIVLLILAGITIVTLTGDNGILTKTTVSREENIKGEEKEKIAIGYNEFRIKKYTDTNPELTVEGATVTGEGPWTITFTKSGRVYELGTDGTIRGQQENLPEDAVASLAKAGEIQRWDKINYNPGSATTASINLPEGASIEGTKLASINLPSGATLGGTISASSATDWVVLDVNQTTGEVLIMPKTVSDVELTLEGKDGYNNAIEAINAVASIYKNSAYATNSRGLTVEDLNKTVNYVPNGEEAEYKWNHRYGMDSNLNIIDAGEGNAPERTFTSTAETGGYGWYFDNSTLCWLASRCVDVGSSGCGFGVRIVYGGDVHDTYLVGVYSGGTTTTGSRRYPVVPVVTLKSNIQLESSSKFYTKTATSTQSSETQDSEYVYEHNTWSFK